MALKAQQSDAKHFVIKRSEFNTAKLFAEFYLPEYQTLLNTLRQSRYPLRSLRDVSVRMFDGPFGSDRKVDMYQESGIPYVRVKQVQHEGIDLSGLVYISQEKHETIIRSRVVPGNVLMTIAGSQLGKAAVFPNTFKEGNITGHIVGIEVGENVNPYYLAVFINSRFGNTQITRWSHRSTRRELNLHEVGQILVSIPPRHIQDSIVRIMQDAYSAKRRKLIEAKQLILENENYVFEILDISKISPTDEFCFSIKRSQLHRLDVRYFSPLYAQLEKIIEEGKYPTAALRSVCKKIVNGITPAKSGYTEDGCVVIKVASLTKNWQIDWQKVEFTSEDFFEKARKAHVKDGDLLLLSASHQLNYIGRSFALVRDIPTEYDSKCITVGELIIVRTNQQLVLPEYLLTCFIIKPIQELVNRLTRGQSAHLYGEDLQYLRVPIPPMEVQQAIVDELDSRRTEAKRLQTEANNLVTQAKVRIDRMILGEEDMA